MRRTFEEWMRLVDQSIQRKVGLDSNDLPDYATRDAYDAGEAPGMVAAAIIRAAMDC